MLLYGYECWSIGVTLMESILNQQQTIHNAICGGQSSTKGYVIWCGNNVMGGDYTQQYINSRDIVIFVTEI